MIALSVLKSTLADQCNYDQADTAGWVPGNESSPKAQASHWGGGCNHSWWLGLEEQGVATGKFFVEPVILTINYAKQVRDDIYIGS